MKKKLTALLLAGALCVIFTACTNTATTSTTATEESVATTATEAVAPSAVETAPQDYTITCEKATGDTAKQSAFDGVGLYDEDAQDIPREKLLITVNDKDGKEIFHLLLNSLLYEGYLEDGNEFMPKIEAKYKTKWLFSFHNFIGENADYYLYDSEADSLVACGSYSKLLLLGNYIVLHPMIFGEFSDISADVFDWNGVQVKCFESIADMHTYHVKLYLLTDTEPVLLESLPLSVFEEENPDFTPKEECSLGNYRAAFYGDNEGDITLYPVDGEGESITCEIEKVTNYLQ